MLVILLSITALVIDYRPCNKCWTLRILPAFIVILLSAQLASTEYLRNAACQRLETAYPDNLSWPGSSSYLNESQSLWSMSTILQPYCVFTPRNPGEVVAALNIFKETQTKFAVKGGGHMTVRGAASIDGGVMMSMSMLRGREMKNNVASLGPGLTWGEVYNWVDLYNRTILGGRYVPVGIAGYLLGGGISFFSDRYGWAANSIRNLEIVTADGKIVNANATSNLDLFWAVKGGSSNFGIVTRFDVETYPGESVTAGTITYNSSATGDVLNTLKAYVEPGGGIDDQYSAILPNIDLVPGSGVVSANVIIMSTNTTSSTVQDFTNLAYNTSTVKQRTYKDFAAESSWSADRSLRDAFWATSLKASARSIDLIYDIIFSAAMRDLKNVSGAMIALSIQPISVSWLRQAMAKGGDALDLDPSTGALLAFNLYITWQNEADDSIITRFAQDALSELDSASRAVDLYYPFIYINDAGAGEDVFPLYGRGRSLPEMRKIRLKYDPDGIFQNLQPGGFKLGF